MTFGLITYVPLRAQEGGETKDDEVVEDEVVEDEIPLLPAYRVDDSQDYAYRATSSMTAIRLTRQVIDSPMAVNILTAEFIEDLAFDNSQEAARYVPNLLADERVSTHRSGGIIYLRGFSTPKQRNGVETFGPSNFNAVDRIEVLKGPVGVFYGNTAPGGIFNVVTKKPEFRNGGSVKYTYGSYNHHTFAIDAQASALDNTLGVRFNGTYLNSEDWRDFEDAEEIYFTTSVRWQPKPRFDLFYEFEDATMKRNDGVNDMVGNPLYHAEYANPPQQIIDFFRDPNDESRDTDEETIDYLRDRWLMAIFNWTQDHRAATGEYVFIETGFIDPFLVSPRGNKFNKNGPGGYDDLFGKSHLFNVSWGPTKWIDIRYQYYDIHSDRDTISNFFISANADYTLIMRDSFNVLVKERRINQQVDLKFTFNTETAGKHEVIYGHEHQHNFRNTFGRNIFDWTQLPDRQLPADPHFKGGDIPLGPDPITVDGTVFRRRVNDYLQDIPNYGDAIASKTQPLPRAPTWLDGHYFTHLGSFFNNRLRTMVGVRWEEEDDGDTGTTPRYGGVFEIVPGWHLFGSYSENWRPNGLSHTGPGVAAAGINAVPLANQLGVGKEIGIKTNWKDNTLSGSISWFTLDRANIRQQDGAAGAADPRNFDDDQNNNVTYWELSGLERVSGVETDFVWTPNRNFQLMFTYSWNYEANIVSDPSRTIPFEIAFQNGRQLHNAPEHNLAVWGKYNFTEGKWKGLSFGLGVRATSAAESGNNQPFRFHVNPGYNVWDSRIGYETKVFGKRTVFSLNLENMFDQTWHSGLALGDPIKAYFMVKAYF